MELRQRTAELKKELTVEARVQLAAAYGTIGLHREQVLECAFVLASEPSPALAAEAARILFGSKFTSPTAVDQLRAALFPS